DRALRRRRRGPRRDRRLRRAVPRQRRPPRRDDGPLPDRRARARDLHFRRAPVPGPRDAGRHGRDVPAGAPLLRLHLRHREHAGRAPGRDAHRPGPLLRRGHTRHLPEGRRARRALGPGRVHGPLRGRRADARDGRVPETDREMKTTRERRTTTPDAGAATHGETTMHDTGTTTRGRGMPARFAASWRRVRALLVKEMRQLLRDPRTQRIIFVAPLLQLVLFSYAATTDVHDVATFLVDHDRTPASRALVDALTASGYFRIVGRFDRPADLAAALD